MFASLAGPHAGFALSRGRAVRFTYRRDIQFPLLRRTESPSPGWDAADRVVLTQDRALLCRRARWLGACVRGALPDDQLRDVLDRFAPRSRRKDLVRTAKPSFSST